MNKDMKKLLYIAFVILMAAGCGERTVDPGPGPNPDPDPKPTPVDPKPPVKEETLAEKIAGEWHCVVSDIDADIYIKIASDSSFELYQKVGDGAHRLYRGTWELDEETAKLSGKYNDGNAWGSSYTVAVSEDKNSMTLVPLDAKEEQVYRRENIPADVKEGCVVEVRSAGTASPVL